MNTSDANELSTVPLSHQRSHGELVITAGEVGRESDGTIPTDFARQAHLALTALREHLEAAGASLATVLKTTVFITRQDHFAAMNAIYAQYFVSPWPARTTLVTGLALAGLEFEIEAIAYRADPAAPALVSK